MLKINNLKVKIEEKEIIKGLSLSIKEGEVHAVMGPNGAGKTTLAMTLMSHPNYVISKSSKIFLGKKNITRALPEERAKQGLYISFQQPVEITGVSVLAFLRTAYKELYPKKKTPLSEFKEKVGKALEAVGLSEDFMQRSLNEGFSGGEKKRMEIAQLLVLKPKFAILDEIDSGLDIDSLRIVAKAVKDLVKKEGLGVLMITHYQRILHHLKPDKVHVLIDGKIKKSDGMVLVGKIERKGYAAI